MNRKAFEKFIFSVNLESSGKASSYVRALDLLSEMLKAHPMGFVDCQQIWDVSSKARVDALYALVRQETNKVPKSKWCELGLPPSYLQKGFCSAALRSYLDFLGSQPQPLPAGMRRTYKEYEEENNRQIRQSLEDSAYNRKKRLSKASKKAEQEVVTSIVYRRNQDVVAEVLLRANGICEDCDNDAPFQRRKNGEPYLEVHHIIPLSENGEDAVDNAMALCPNCHREAHYG
ncbi:HNH endonuclease [Opitutales bacterium]|nr:HNH endonuclease [Opitutales bacterium]